MSDPYTDNWPKTEEAKILAAFLGAGFESPKVSGKNLREAMLYALGLPMDAASELARLRAEVEGLRADAERWRKVRSGNPNLVTGRPNFWLASGCMTQGVSGYSGDEADRAIDLARSQGGK